MAGTREDAIPHSPALVRSGLHRRIGATACAPKRNASPYQIPPLIDEVPKLCGTFPAHETTAIGSSPRGDPRWRPPRSRRILRDPLELIRFDRPSESLEVLAGSPVPNRVSAVGPDRRFPEDDRRLPPYGSGGPLASACVTSLPPNSPPREITKVQIAGMHRTDRGAGRPSEKFLAQGPEL